MIEAEADVVKVRVERRCGTGSNTLICLSIRSVSSLRSTRLIAGAANDLFYQRTAARVANVSTFCS